MDPRLLQGLQSGLKQGAADVATQQLKQRLGGPLGTIAAAGLGGAMGLQKGGRVGADCFGSPATYKADGGWLSSLFGNANPTLAAAEKRAAELNEVNKNLGLDVNLEATGDQGRLMADRHALFNEILGQGGPKAIGEKALAKQALKDKAMEDAGFDPIGTMGQTWDSIRALFGDNDVDLSDAVAAKAAAEAAPKSPGALSAAQQAAVDARIKEIDNQLLMEPLKLRTGGPALAKKKQPKIDGWTGATVKHKQSGGAIMSPTGTESFMMQHGAGAKERMGPLAKTTYKNKGGEVWERSYHNPLAAQTYGGDKKEEK